MILRFLTFGFHLLLQFLKWFQLFSKVPSVTLNSTIVSHKHLKTLSFLWHIISTVHEAAKQPPCMMPPPPCSAVDWLYSSLLASSQNWYIPKNVYFGFISPRFLFRSFSHRVLLSLCFWSLLRKRYRSPPDCSWSSLHVLISSLLRIQEASDLFVMIITSSSLQTVALQLSGSLMITLKSQKRLSLLITVFLMFLYSYLSLTVVENKQEKQSSGFACSQALI